MGIRKRCLCAYSIKEICKIGHFRFAGIFSSESRLRG
jgi:hypothetical protein